MKRFKTLVCIIACVLGLTACGNEKEYSEYEMTKLEYAQSLSVQQILPMLETLSGEEGCFDGYTNEEIAYIVGNNYQVSVDGYGMTTALDSYALATKEMGAILSYGETTAEIDGNEIIVYVEVLGEKKNAKAELIYGNDLFMELKASSLNPIASKAELMKKASLNTLVGMGTVFVVLILISLIISCFRIIPYIQKKSAEKKEAKKQLQTTGIDNAVAQIVTQEEAVNEASDLELVAVISAAIAAYEGSASTDGYVVRSIIRRR